MSNEDELAELLSRLHSQIDRNENILAEVKEVLRRIEEREAKARLEMPKPKEVK